MRMRAFSLVGIIALVVIAGMPQLASAGVITADAAIVHIRVVFTPNPNVVRFRALAEDLGPDNVVGDSFDVHYQDVSGLRVRHEHCGLGISPDTPYCEYGEVTVGERIVTSVKARIVSSTGSITFCTSYEGSTVDPDHSNDCATSFIA